MKLKKVVSVLAVVLCIVLIAAGCSKKEGDDSNPSKETFQGELREFFNDKLIVKSSTETKEFTVAVGTQYEYSKAGYLEIGDIVEVTYHKESSAEVADFVKVTQHEEKTNLFSGVLLEVYDKYIAVTGTQLTAVIEYDNSTKIQGRLSYGDLIEVEYTGDISGDPHAVRITVLQENEEPEYLYAYGIVSEVTDTAFVLSIDSADANHFALTSDTVIQGEAKTIQVGDSVSVTFKKPAAGQIPQAAVVDIIKAAERKEEKKYTINGTIENISTKTVTLKTSTASYVFTVTDTTKYTGEKFETGVNAEVTYTGNLVKDPVAVAIYCSKPTPPPEPPTEKPTEKPTEPPTEQPTEKPTEAPTEKPTEKPTEPPTEEPTEKPTEEPTEEPTEQPTEPPTEKPTPTIPEVRAGGLIIKWGEKIRIEIDTGKEIELTVVDDLKIASGYFPEEGDIVEFKYRPTEAKITAIDLKGRKSDVIAGWVSAFEAGKCKILFTTGEEKELILDETTDILTGYTPKKDDFVYFKTDKDLTKLTFIRFLSHPEKLESSELYKSVQELAKARNNTNKQNEEESKGEDTTQN